jgi:hypothetical protein
MTQRALVVPSSMAMMYLSAIGEPPNVNRVE